MKNKKCVLNVGGGPSRNLPPYYDNWEQHLLDIDKNVNPDICCDARELQIQDVYDAVYTSHTLEHFYKHEIPLILSKDRKSTRLNSSHSQQSRMPSSA